MYNLDEMKKKEVLNYWIKASDDDFKAMNSLFKEKHYSWSLFVGHLVIEKLLKAYYVKKISQNAPYTHDLLRIASMAKLELNDELMDFLNVVTSFNIKTRYDDHKLDFKKKCTKAFTKNNIKKIREFRNWVKKKL